METSPTENEQILIQFDLDGRIDWWTAVVISYLPKISSKPTQRTKERVKYHDLWVTKKKWVRSDF